MKTERNKQSLQEELKEISPLLAEQEKKNPFKVPENYFSNLSSQILEKIRIDEESKTQNSLLNRLEEWMDQIALQIFKPKFVLAGVVVLFLSITSVHYFFHPVDAPYVSPISVITDKQAEDYVADNIYLFDEEDMIVAYLAAIDPEELEMQLNRATEDDLEEYILENIDQSFFDELDI